VKLAWIKINLAQRRDCFARNAAAQTRPLLKTGQPMLLKTMKSSPPVVRAANFPYQGIRPAIRWLMEAAAQSKRAGSVQCDKPCKEV
jgi:hypothetical protein